MAIKKKQQKLNFDLRFLPFIVGILLIAVGWFFLLPQINRILEMWTDLKRERSQLSKLQEKLVYLKGLNEYELSQRTELSLKAIPSEKNFIGTLLTIRQLAENDGLIMKSFKVTPGVISPQKKGVLGFKIVVSGDAGKIRFFLADLEKILPLINPVDKLQLEIRTSTDINLSLESYYIPFPEKIGSLDAPVSGLTSNEEKTLQSLSDFTSLDLEDFSNAASASGRPNPFVF